MLPLTAPGATDIADALPCVCSDALSDSVLTRAIAESDAAAAAASERAARAPARPKSKRGGGVAAAIEVELYQDIDYRQLSPRFHAFEAEWFVVGFAFASEAEAKKLLSKVKGLRPRADTTPPPQHLFVSRGDSWSNRFKRMLGFGPATPPPRAPPPVVSTVTEFKHTTHVGMNEDGSWDLQVRPHRRASTAHGSRRVHTVVTHYAR